MSQHFLAPPFHLPDGRDARLVRHLQDDDWAAATTMLRDVVTSATTEWKWLVLLAYVRFRDASDVLPDELTDASREALGLLERAMMNGAPLEEVAPFREAVERTLDQLSRGEEALLARLGRDDDASAMTDDELESVSVLLARSQPARAAKLFDVLAERQKDSPVRHVSSARAALARVAAGRFDEAKAALDDALTHDWSTRPLADDRLTLEAVETTLLEHASGAEFIALWHLATERGAALAFPFPSVWPHQERLFQRCLTLRDFAKARALATRIESERTEIPRALSERLKAIHIEQA
ncbi:MAG: hypothetical protein QM817_32955 [Archangium sp.]